MIKFSLKNVLNRATVDASTEAENFEAANMIISQPTKSWKSANPFADHTIDFTYDREIVSSFALFNLECTTEAMINVKIFDGLDLVKEINLTGEQVVYGYGEGPYGLFAYGGYSAPGREWMRKFRVIWFEDVYSDNMLITITQSPDISIGYVHLGPSWNPPFGINKDYSSNFLPIANEIVRNVAGISVGPFARTYRQIDITLIMLTSEDVDFLLENMLPNIPIVFSAFAEMENSENLYATMLCKIPSGISVVGVPHKRFSAANLALEEMK